MFRSSCATALRLALLLPLLLRPAIGHAQHLNIYCEDNLQHRAANGQMTGLDIEIVTELQRRTGNNDTIQLVPWTRGVKYLDSMPDTLLFSMARTKERDGQYQWIGPISETAYAFFGKADAQIVINSLDDAKKVTSIGVVRNDVRDKYLTELGFTNLDRTSNNESNLKKLMADRVDVIASSELGIRSELRLTGFKSHDVRHLYTFLKLPVYIAASAQPDPKVVAEWNQAIDAMKKDGTLAAIFKKYTPD